MAPPRVSVIMSVFNGERYLRKAVDSILAQTFTDFEYLIVDDGSTDGTAEILQSYQDPRIRIFRQENRGLTASLNRALGLARGGYVARMDADDIAQPERFQKQVDFLDARADVAVVGTYAYRIDEKDRIVCTYTFKTENDDIRADLSMTCPFCHSSIMFRKICVGEVGGYREKVGPTEDLDLYFRLSEKFSLANIPEPLQCFRINPEGVTLKRRFDQIRYERLVRMMAKERMEYGKDRLDGMSDREIDQLLESLLPKTRRNEEKVMSDSCVYLADVAYIAEDYRRSAEWLCKHLALRPLSGRGWFLAAKLAACSIAGKDTLRRIGVMSKQP
ncbi:MAG TPA: glycosyltransferase [Syntrophales bacterium]|nr:glycosyltransferase [Syntrophales bacterium]